MLYLLHKPDGPPLRVGVDRGPVLAATGGAPMPGADTAALDALMLPDAAGLVLPGDAHLALPV